MLGELKCAARVLAGLTLLTGLLYPLSVGLVAQIAMPWRANGSPLERDGRVVGSALVGQSFEDPRYLWGRPSGLAIAYDARTSGGTNFGPMSPQLADRLSQRSSALVASAPGPTRWPSDLLTSSGSGLDPHVSPASARLQLARIAAAREVELTHLEVLLSEQIEPPWLGIFGEARVNVLEFNLALDKHGTH